MGSYEEEEVRSLLEGGLLQVSFSQPSPLSLMHIY